MILALDPGTFETACCLYSIDQISACILKNEELLIELKKCEATKLYIEMIASYGMPVGSEIFETCVWIGRFIEAWGGDFEFVYRKDVKIHLCQSMKAKDSNIRRALIDRFGESGTKKKPGKLYGFKKDMWAALGVAVTAYDRQTKEEKLK